VTDDEPDPGSLRALWKDLPDEEPSARGHDLLMAAARAHAQTLVKAPWWQRVADVLRRPPVLALATIVVLASGALVVRNANQALPTAPANAPASGSTAAPALDQAAAPALAPAPSAPVATPPPVPPPAQPAPAPPTPKAALERDHHEAKPVVRAPNHPRNEASGKTLDDLERAAPAEAPAPAADPLQSEGQAWAAPEAAPAPATTTTKSRPSPGGGALAALTVTQLVTRCRTAAQSGDCTTVRAVMRELSARSAKDVQALGPDPDVRKCMIAD